MNNFFLISIFLSVFVLAAPTLAGLWVWQEVQQRMSLRVTGRYSPEFFAPSFVLRDARFEWDEKVKLISGDLLVDFEPVSLLTGLLRVRLQSPNPEIELLGEWAEAEGVSRVKLDHFEAHLGFARGGLREIYFLDARSPSFQFHLQKSGD